MKRKYLLLICLFAFNITLSGSRTGFIALLAGLLLIYILKNGLKRIYKSILFIFVFTFSLYHYINSSLPGSAIFMRLVDGFSGRTVIGDGFNERMYFIDIGLSMFYQKPIIGFGIGGFGSYLGLVGHANQTYSHNNYIEILSCMGIIGFVLYYSMYFYILKNARNNLRLKCNYAILALTIIMVLLISEYGSISYNSLTVLIPVFISCYASLISKQTHDTIEVRL
jgi:O-antigen ligase